jgi:hypothetical protein
MIKNIFTALTLALLLSACSGLRTTSYQNPVSSVKPYKLNSANVVWVSNDILQYSITKRYRKFAEVNSKIIPGDLASSRTVVGEIVTSFKESLPTKLAQQLEANEIPFGNEHTFEITPIFANYECTAIYLGRPCEGGLIREFKLNVTLKRNDNGAHLFSTKTETFITNTKPENYDAIITEHASSIIMALINQNWLCSSEKKRFNQCFQKLEQ